MPNNEELIMKAITTSTLAQGGALNDKQSEAFVRLIRESTALLGKVRLRRMTQGTEEINKLNLGEPITVKGAENTDSGNDWSPKFNTVTLTALKITSSWNIPTETFQNNIEQNGFEQTLMESASQRIAQDTEELAIEGDTTISGTTPRESLLKANDGWAKLTESAHIVDANGENISKGLLLAGLRRMPKQYKKRKNELRFLVSDAIAEDWLERISDRQTNLGDAALEGAVATAFGIKIVEIPNIPDTDSVAVTSLQPGRIKGDEIGPFVFDATNKTVKINTVNVDFTIGTALETVTVAKQINDDVTAVFAFDDGEGRLIIEQRTAGAASSVVTAAGDTNDGIAILGLAAETNAGTDAGTAGTELAGSFIWLVNPSNFIYGILDGPRMFTEFNKELDRVEFVMHNQVDFEVENLDAVVKITNVRRFDLF